MMIQSAGVLFLLSLSLIRRSHGSLDLTLFSLGYKKEMRLFKQLSRWQAGRG